MRQHRSINDQLPLTHLQPDRNQEYDWKKKQQPVKRQIKFIKKVVQVRLVLKIPLKQMGSIPAKYPLTPADFLHCNQAKNQDQEYIYCGEDMTIVSQFCIFSQIGYRQGQQDH